METTRRPGFSIPGYAAAAAHKAWLLGVAHRWTVKEARAASAKAAVARREHQKESADDGRTDALVLT